LLLSQTQEYGSKMVDSCVHGDVHNDPPSCCARGSARLAATSI
jgi:hypothetical protein